MWQPKPSAESNVNTRNRSEIKVNKSDGKGKAIEDEESTRGILRAGCGLIAVQST